MSWISGNDNTSAWTDFTSLFHNATTGELTQAQKDEIAQATTQDYTPCRNNLSSADCVALLSQERADVEAAAPDSGCVLNAPFLPCFKSWGSVAFAAVGTLVVIWLLLSIITSPTAYIRSRG